MPAEFAGGYYFRDLRRKTDRLQVEAISRNDLLDEHEGTSDIVLLSIAMEGRGQEVLTTFGFSAPRIKSISVEQTPGITAPIAAAYGYR